eukprot:10877239-Lingulodinium_polyedra.AAC.1
MESEPGGAGPEQGDPGAALGPRAHGEELEYALATLEQQLNVLRAQREQRCGPFGPLSEQRVELARWS